MDTKNTSRRTRRPDAVAKKPHPHVTNRFTRLANKIKARNISTTHLAITGLVIFMVILVFIIIFSLTNKNAVEVFLNDESMGIVKKSDTLTSEYIKELALKKLQAEFNGTNIQVNDTINTTPIHASKKEMIDLDIVTGEIYKKFDYKVEAFAITVDGTEMVIVLSNEEADEILNNIKSKFIPADMNILPDLTTFVETVTTQSKFVNKEDIMSKDNAYEILTKSLDSELIYEVKSGDTLSKIATAHNMSLDDIFKLNADINATTVLKIGQKLTLSVPKPLLSVKTVEEQKIIEVKPKVTKTQDNPREKKGISRVIQQGKDGQQEVTLHITRVNGFEISREPVGTPVVTVEPVDEIIEQGSK